MVNPSIITIVHLFRISALLDIVLLVLLVYEFRRGWWAFVKIRMFGKDLYIHSILSISTNSRKVEDAWNWHHHGSSSNLLPKLDFELDFEWV
jgi:hypothetical protein